LGKPFTDGYAGAYATFPPNDEDSTWLTVRWHFENENVKFDFVWSNPDAESVATADMNAVLITPRDGPDPTPGPVDDPEPIDEFLIFNNCESRPGDIVRLTYHYRPATASPTYIQAMGIALLSPVPQGAQASLPLLWTPGTYSFAVFAIPAGLDARIPPTCTHFSMYFDGPDISVTDNGVGYIRFDFYDITKTDDTKMAMEKIAETNLLFYGVAPPDPPTPDPAPGPGSGTGTGAGTGFTPTLSLTPPEYYVTLTGTNEFTVQYDSPHVFGIVSNFSLTGGLFTYEGSAQAWAVDPAFSQSQISVTNMSSSNPHTLSLTFYYDEEPIVTYTFKQ
jgi:hypothetical protein